VNQVWVFLYVCNFLIQHNADVHECYDFALRQASKNGYKDSVALLLKHNANIHAGNDFALSWAELN
jgi:ankyrin repeat protein